MANTGIYDSDFEEIESTYNAGAEDSDNESLTDANSPTDGYFEQRDLPQQTYIQNPAAEAAKDLEATSGEPLNNRLETTSDAQPSAPTRIADSPAPILDAGPAPPDYAAATAGRREQQREAFGSDHPLVRNGLIGERGVRNSRDQPQSMRDDGQAQPAATAEGTPRPTAGESAAVGEVDEETGLLSGKQSKKKRSRNRLSRYMKSCAMVLAVVVLIILAIIATERTHKDRSPLPDDNPDQRLPVQDPPKGPTPPHPRKSGQCTFNSFSRTSNFGFHHVESGFTFLELLDFTNYNHLFPSGASISGTVKISLAMDEQERNGPDIIVSTNVATTQPISILDLNYNMDSINSLQVLFPDIQLNGWAEGTEACFDFAVAIHVRKGVRVQDWETSTVNLNIIVDEGLFGKEEKGKDFTWDGLRVLNETTISAVKGNLDVAYWHSDRRTIVDTISGKIEGTFALRDLLSLTSTSGSIGVNVDPKEADKELPVPAEFIAKSTSGTIDVRFPTIREGELPDRDYKTRVETQSSDIKGTYILGQTARFLTTSGTTTIDVMPYSANLAGSTLWTESTSGSTYVEVLEPYHADSYGNISARKHREGVIDELHSRHKSVSGKVEVKYPQEWEGKIDGETISGSITLRGRDVEKYTDIGIPGVKKRVIGHKGTGKSEMDFRTMSGDIDVLIGDDW